MDRSLDEGRRQRVTRRNDMIQRGKSTLTKNETKIVMYMLSKVKPDDKPGKTYYFNCNEFKSIFRWKRNSFMSIFNMLREMQKKSWWISNGEKEHALLFWFRSVRVDEEKDIISVKFADDMNSYILNLAKQKEEKGLFYTSFPLQYYAMLRRNYSARIYELLKTYAFNNKKWIFEIGTGSECDIQMLIAEYDPETQKEKIPINWANSSQFDRDVLKPAKEEINKFTDLNIEYNLYKRDLSGTKTRKYRTVEFLLVHKTNLEQSLLEEELDNIYVKKGEGKKYTELEKREEKEKKFFEDHEKKVEAEERVKKIIVENSKKEKYPVLNSVLGKYYNDEQIESMYNISIQHISTIRIKKENWEFWVLDFIQHYRRWITATKDKTKTTEYVRLIDSLKKDYDQIALQPSQWDILKR